MRRDHRAISAADEHRPERLQGRRQLEELFNFGNDYLGLVKAGGDRLGPDSAVARRDAHPARRPAGRVVRPGHGLEVVSKVNDIPKGSRLAVSTNLLASLIALLMRATGQARNLTGPLEPEEARVVVARAILGEWLGGSGGGWQDSGGVFPGVKMIQGVAGRRGRPRVGRQPRPAAAGPRALNDGDSAGSAPALRPSPSPSARREPGAGSRRDGPERRADPQHGHRANICSASSDEWEVRQRGPGDLRGDRPAPSGPPTSRRSGG